MSRFLSFCAASCLFIGLIPSLGWAQSASAPEERWELGVQALRVTSHARSTTELGLRISRRMGARWGLRASVRHAFFDAPSQPGFGATYDRRQIGGTVALFWQPVQFRTGPIGHSLRAHAGPMVQARRATRTSVAICATGLPTDDLDTFIERRYPKQERGLDAGAQVGLGYGLRYGAVTARFVVTARNAQFDRSNWTSGAGTTLTVRF